MLRSDRNDLDDAKNLQKPTEFPLQFELSSQSSEQLFASTVVSVRAIPPQLRATVEVTE